MILAIALFSLRIPAIYLNDVCNQASEHSPDKLYKYCYSFSPLLLFNDSLNNFIIFLNDNLFIIKGSALFIILNGILFFAIFHSLKSIFIILMDSDSNTSNTNSNLSNNNYNVNFGSEGAGSSSNSSEPSKSFDSSNNNFVSPHATAAIGIAASANVAAAKIARVNPRVATIVSGVGNSTAFGIYTVGELARVYSENNSNSNKTNYNEDISYQRSDSPPPNNNFNINSSNENDFNLTKLFSKYFGNTQELFDYINTHLTSSDGNPTPAFIFYICAFAFWGTLCCIFLIISFLSKLIKIEQTKFVTSRPLLHKTLCFMISMRD
jgi:hypothetical protein